MDVILEREGVKLLPLQNYSTLQSIMDRIHLDIPSRAGISPAYVELGGMLTDTWEHELLGIEHEGELVGYVKITHNRWPRISMTSMGIVPEHRGKGIGKKAKLLVLKYIFEVIGMHRAECYVFSFNERSLALQRPYMAEEGRQREAVFWGGKYWDKYIFGIVDYEYSRLKKEYQL